MYLARNSNGCLWLHTEKPQRITINGKGYWHSAGYKMPINSRSIYPRWQDQPIPVEINKISICE